MPYLAIGYSKSVDIREQQSWLVDPFIVSSDLPYILVHALVLSSVAIFAKLPRALNLRMSPLVWLVRIVAHDGGYEVSENQKGTCFMFQQAMGHGTIHGNAMQALWCGPTRNSQGVD